MSDDQKVKVYVLTPGRIVPWKGFSYHTPTSLIINKADLKTFAITCKAIGVTDVKFEEINPKQKKKKQEEPKDVFKEVISKNENKEIKEEKQNIKEEEPAQEEKQTKKGGRRQKKKQ